MDKHIILFKRPTLARVLWIFRNRGFVAGVLACLSMGAGEHSHAALYESEYHLWHQFWRIRRQRWSDIPRTASWQDYDIYRVPAENYCHKKAIEWFEKNEGMPYDYLYWFGAACYRLLKLFGKTFSLVINDRKRTYCFEAIHEAIKSQGVLPYEPLPNYIYGNDLVRCYGLEFMRSGTIK